MQIVIDDEKIIDLLETEWGYEGIREDVRRLLIENGTPTPKQPLDEPERKHEPCEGCISRQAAIDAVETIGFDFSDSDLSEVELEEVCEAIGEVRQTWSQRIKRLPSVEPEPCGDIGEISDGYHTFNQLYHQRAILFAAIVNQNKGISWKSYKHSDGKYCFDSNGEWFIVGVDTPEGPYTYHYSKEYWDYFDCQILECGKEWDGHTEDDVTRLLSLTSVEPEKCGDYISRKEAIRVAEQGQIQGYVWQFKKLCSLPSVEPERKTGKWIEHQWAEEENGLLISNWECNLCKMWERKTSDFCPNCGAKMEVDE